MLTAIVNGDVDVVVPWDPFRTSALRQLGDNGVDVSPGENLVLSPSALARGRSDGSQPEVFKAFIEGIVEATWIIRQDPESVAPVVLNFIQGVTEEDAIDAMERNSLRSPHLHLHPMHGPSHRSAVGRAGRFEVDAPFTADDLLDRSLLDEVLAENPEWIADLPPLPENVEDCEGYEGLQQ